MAGNNVQRGKTLTWTNDSGADVSSGDPVKIGVFVGVAQVDIPQNAAGAVDLEEVWNLPKTTGEAWTVGVQLYFNNTTKAFTTTASGNTKSGKAFSAAATGDTTGDVRLTPDA